MENKKEKLKALIFILLTSIFVSIPLLSFNIQYDDGVQHICRLIGTMQSIEEKGLIFPVIMQKFCNGFGYSWNLFYSPITAYIPLAFKIFSFSYENCLKAFMFVVSIASGYSMFFFMKKILINRKDITDERKNLISILGACLYILAPYRLTDMYIRVAVAELTSFIFIPIVFNGLYSIIKRKEKNYILAFGIIGMILSHTLITFYLAIICTIYVIINFRNIKKREILELTKNIGFGLLITAFYIVPLIECKLSSSYEVFKSSHMLREDVLIGAKVKLEELIFIKQDRMAYFLGIPLIVGIVFTPFIIKNKKVQDKKNYYFFLIAGLICVTLTLDFIPFEKFPSIMTMMQFSFRLLEFSSFFLSAISALNFGLNFNKFNLPAVVIIILVTADLLIPICMNIDFSKRYVEENVLEEGIRVTEKTGRVHAGCASFEYLPSKAFENRSYIENREDYPIVIEGNAIIKEFNKNGTNASFKVEGSGKIELPYIYYIGYTVRSNNKKLKITESDKGFLQIEVDEEKKSTLNNNTEKNDEFQNTKDIQITVSYEGSLAMKLSTMISLLTIIVGIIAIVNKKVHERITNDGIKK